MTQDKWCFHHIPKTAGTSLQLRISHREWAKELDPGSTLVVSPLGSHITMYRVKNDPQFDPHKPFKQALKRHQDRQTQGSARIVMGHLTTVAQQGKHVTWIRHPLDRDLSHHRYDMNNYSNINPDPQKHLSSIEGDFLFTWLWSRYMGRKGGANSKDHAFEQVLDTLDRMERVFLHSDFESSWEWIAQKINVSVEPRLNTNVSTSKHNQDSRLSVWHKKHNPYDYKIWEYVQKFKL